MPTILRFGSFEFHPQSGELIAGGVRTRLEPQPAKVLAILAARAGEVVTRDELQKEVWPAEVFVDFERGLNYCITRIRRALDDSASAPRFVETLPKRGYRFLPAVERLPAAEAPMVGQVAGLASGSPPGAPRGLPRERSAASFPPAGFAPSATAAPPVQRRRWWWPRPARNAAAWVSLHAATVATVVIAALVAIAVAVALRAGGAPAGGAHSRRTASVPTVAITRFDNETGRADLDRAAEVLGDTLVERLAREPERWSVIGNAAILRAPRAVRNLEAIRSSLHADFILLGQILPGERGLTILTHLIRASDQRHLWVGRFEVSSTPAPGVADRIAAIVAAAAARRISGGR